MSTFKHPGDNLTVNNDTGGPLSIDDIVLVGDLVGVVLEDSADTEDYVISVSGVHSLPAEVEAFAEGDNVYFNEANGTVTVLPNGGANHGMGHATTAKGAEAGNVEVRLQQSAT